MSDEVFSDMAFSYVDGSPYTRVGTMNLIRGWRSSGGRIGFTNGCFDLLHVGHLDGISRLARLCVFVIVGVNSDESAERLKGAGHPVIPLAQRVEMLCALRDVNMVIPFDNPFPLTVIMDVKPDVLLKGDEHYGVQFIGADVVTDNGGEVIRAPMVPDISTSKIIERIRDAELL